MLVAWNFGINRLFLASSTPFGLLNALLEIQITNNIHAVASYRQWWKCFPKYFKEIFVSYQIHLFSCHLPSIRHKINNNHCFQSFFRLRNSCWTWFSKEILHFSCKFWLSWFSQASIFCQIKRSAHNFVW